MKKFISHFIISDDLDVAPDFYEYFSATYPILRSDPTLWCVSAWNDNGKLSCFVLFLRALDYGKVSVVCLCMSVHVMTFFFSDEENEFILV